MRRPRLTLRHISPRDTHPADAPVGHHSPAPVTGDDWLLGDGQRGNDATRLPPWTDGNSVRPLLDGDEYLSCLGEELERTGPGDLVLVGAWRLDADQQLGPHTTVGQAFAGSAARGAAVRGLVWHSHPSWTVGSWRENMQFARRVNRAGGQVLLDQRIRPAGSHHQKFVVIRRAADPARDVAFVGGVDLARSRADDPEHRGDPLPRDFARVYGPRPAWHDRQVELRGPAVGDIEQTFRERWTDPAALTRLPWQRLMDRLSGLPARAGPLPAPRPAPPRRGTSRVQVLRTYPTRRPAHPFAPDGEYSVARALTKALSRARHLVYIEDQYLWSEAVGRVLDSALQASPELRIVAVCPRFPDQEGHLKVPPKLLGQGLLLRSLSASVRDRVTLLSPEDEQGRPIYVHSKTCIIDDAWALVGSANLNRRSWSHDSELSVAVVGSSPGPGDGFARELRLQLMREHLGRRDGDDADLRDPHLAVQVLRRAVDDLETWHRNGRSGSRPPGRLRRREMPDGERWRRALIAPAYHLLFDPDGRPPRTDRGRRR